MSTNGFGRTSLFLGLSTILLFSCGIATAADTENSNEHRGKVVAAYFEEWSIYGAGYNIADIQNSGAAYVLTHVLYAFANVSSTGQCTIADSWADYQTPYLPPVNGQPYKGTVWQFCGASSTERASPKPEGAHLNWRSFSGKHG